MLRESGDPVEIPDEALRLIGACEVRVRHDERADRVGLDCQPLRGTVAHLCVLHEYHPTLLSYMTEPFFVGEALADALAIDIGHGVDGRAGGAQRIRYHVAAEASIDEELTRRCGGQRG